jgi:hypothetical protein
MPTRRAKVVGLKLLQQDRAHRLPGEAFNNRSGHAPAQGFRDRAERGPTTDLQWALHAARTALRCHCDWLHGCRFTWPFGEIDLLLL